MLPERGGAPGREFLTVPARQEVDRRAGAVSMQVLRSEEGEAVPAAWISLGTLDDLLALGGYAPTRFETDALEEFLSWECGLDYAVIEPDGTTFIVISGPAVNEPLTWDDARAALAAEIVRACIPARETVLAHMDRHVFLDVGGKVATDLDSDLAASPHPDLIRDAWTGYVDREEVARWLRRAQEEVDQGQPRAESHLALLQRLDVLAHGQAPFSTRVQAGRAEK